MRKTLFICLLLGMLLIALPAMAEVFTFDDVHLSIEIPADYTVITAENAAANAHFLLSKGYNADEVPEIFAEEGVRFKAYAPSGDACFQLICVQDVDAQRYFDIDQQSAKERAAWRKEHLKGETYTIMGIKYTDGTWKKTTKYGRVMQLRYTQKEGDEIVSRGYQRKTIKNGYTITFDWQVTGRTLKSADNAALNKIMSTVSIYETQPVPATAVGALAFTDIPPEETNTAKFNIKGTGRSGLKITATQLRLSSTDAKIITATVNKKGNFTMPVTLPAEGVYMLTLTVENGEALVEEIAYPPITYKSTLLPVNVLQGVPTQITTDKLTITGTSIKGAKIQLLYGDTNKTVTVGGGGTFTFKVDTAKEGVYDFTLVASKKGCETRRFSYTGTRSFTQEESQSALRKGAVKPGYKNLVNKITGYDGRVMVYTPHITKIEQNGADWLITMALTRLKTGEYRDIIMVSMKDEPSFTVGASYKMYLRCIGMYTVLSESGGETAYPHFEFLFIDQ